MRLAIFSDIHGNLVALEAVLADLQRAPVDQLVCLGDAIQGGPQPAEVTARLRRLACPVVMGNADDWLLTGQETGDEQIDEERLRKLNVVREWSLARLSDLDRADIAGFQPTVEVALEAGQRLLCFHGSPASFYDLIMPDTPAEDVQRWLGAYPDHFLAGGHTHLQQIRHLGRKFFFNPGSVGVVYRHGQEAEKFRLDPWAEYAVLTSEGERLGLEFRRVPVDLGALRAAYESSGRPFAAESLAQYGL